MELVTSPSAPTSTFESDNAAAPNGINMNSNANDDERVVVVVDNNQESVHSLPPPVVNEDNKEKLFIHETAAPSSTDTDGDGREMNDTQQQQQQIPITKSSNHSSLLTPNNNNAPPTPVPPSSSNNTLTLNEAKIDKATSFLRNTELNNISTLEKRNYLKEKVGMTFDEINVAFDRVANAGGSSGGDYNDGQRGMNMGSTSNSRDEKKNAGQLRERQGYNNHRSNNGRFDDNDGRQRGDGYNDQNHHNQQQQRQDDAYNHRGQERQRQPPSQYNTSYNTDPNYNTNMSGGGGGGGGGGPIMAAHDQAPPQPQSSIVPAAGGGGGWMGGFSLGIFCLAAIRWLNGGDFILFPPPTSLLESTTRSAMENGRLQKGVEEEGSAVLDNGEDGATDTSDSHHHEEEEENELQEEEVVVDNVDYQEEGEEYEPIESNEDDDGINMILNGTTSSNAQHFLHNPNNHELALEIRALTSAIHTYRDVQERSHRAVTAHVGKGMTDDAMDFLRQSKNKSEVEDGGSKSVEGVCLKEENVVMIAKKLLEDVSDDLGKLKESLAVQFEDNSGNGDSEKQGDDSDDAKGSGSTEKKLNSEQQEPLKQIDKVMEKVQQMMSVMEKNTVKPKEEESVTTSKEDELNKGDSTVETTENKGISDDSTTTAPMASATTDKQGDEKTTPSTSESSSQEQSSNSEEATTQQATTATTMEQLEEALKRLANNNNNNNNNNPTNLKVGAQMLYLYCLNISKNPSVPRYRKIYTNNNTFRNKVGNLDGAKELLLSVGFVERASFFEWGAAAAAAAASEEESSSKSKLDFALVALEMMKNGSTTTNKSSNGDGADDTVTGDAALPTLVEEVPSLESKEVTSEAAISAAVSIAGLAGKGIDLN